MSVRVLLLRHAQASLFSCRLKGCLGGAKDEVKRLKEPPTRVLRPTGAPRLLILIPRIGLSVSFYSSSVTLRVYLHTI